MAAPFEIRSSTTTQNGNSSTSFRIHHPTPDGNLLTRPFLTAAQMEHLQHSFGCLRRLKPSTSRDDASESAYRHSTYSIYTNALNALISTSERSKTAQCTIITCLGIVDKNFQCYFHFLDATVIQPQLTNMPGVSLIDKLSFKTDEFLHKMHHCYSDVCEDSIWDLHVGLFTLQTHILELASTMERSCCDGILNLAECQRLLATMERQEKALTRLLEEMQTLVFDAKEWGRRMCFVIVRVLRESGGFSEEGEEDGEEGRMARLVRVVEEFADGGVGDHWGMVDMIGEEDGNETDDE